LLKDHSGKGDVGRKVSAYGYERENVRGAEKGRDLSILSAKSSLRAFIISGESQKKRRKQRCVDKKKEDLEQKKRDNAA